MKKTQKYTGTQVELKSNKLKGRGIDRIRIKLPNGDRIDINTYSQTSDLDGFTAIDIHTKGEERLASKKTFISEDMNFKAISTGTDETYVATFTRLNTEEVA